MKINLVLPDLSKEVGLATGLDLILMNRTLWSWSSFMMSLLHQLYLVLPAWACYDFFALLLCFYLFSLALPHGHTLARKL